MPLNPNVNRVTAMIRKRNDLIAERLATGKVTQERLDSLYKSLDMDLEEFCRFQSLKSLAFAGGKLTLDEAQTIYLSLGESVESFNAQPLAVKSVLTQIFQELLEMRIRAKRRTG